jgi:hypothetical protein
MKKIAFTKPKHSGAGLNKGTDVFHT